MRRSGRAWKGSWVGIVSRGSCSKGCARHLLSLEGEGMFFVGAAPRGDQLSAVHHSRIAARAQLLHPVGERRGQNDGVRSTERRERRGQV